MLSHIVWFIPTSVVLKSVITVPDYLIINMKECNLRDQLLPSVYMDNEKKMHIKFRLMRIIMPNANAYRKSKRLAASSIRESKCAQCL